MWTVFTTQVAVKSSCYMRLYCIDTIDDPFVSSATPMKKMKKNAMHKYIACWKEICISCFILLFLFKIIGKRSMDNFKRQQCDLD